MRMYCDIAKRWCKKFGYSTCLECRSIFGHENNPIKDYQREHIMREDSGNDNNRRGEGKEDTA